MKKITLLFVIVSVLSLSDPALSETVYDANHIPEAHVLWDKLPIGFSVPVGHERLLSFPDKVKVINDDPNLTSDKVTILNNAGTLYIKTKQVFDPVRLRVVMVATGETILVDLSGVAEGDDSPLSVVLASATATPVVDANQDTATKHSQTTTNVVSLTRYAVQHLYSPERLLEDNPNIYRTPMYTQRSVVLTTGDQFSAFPLISWRGGELYVTAVLLRNDLSQPTAIHPQSFLGCWQSVSLYPLTSLSESGTSHDRTTVFLVSSEPFGEALQKQCPVSREVIA